MNIANLSFSGLPPISVPFRYFLTAPLFLITAAILILFYGDIIWYSRWHPVMLAITHLFTLGFMSMIMMGAIYQFLPVIGGVGIQRPQRIANVTHTLHVVGTIALVINFIASNDVLLWFSLCSLTVGFSIYLHAVTRVLYKKLSQGDTIVGIRFAIACLFIVLLFGIILASKNTVIAIFESTSFLHLKTTTDIHALIGGFGWAGLLIISVSFQVVPMFHVTPNHSAFIRNRLTKILFILILSLLIFAPDTLVGQLIIMAILLLNGCFAISLLMLFKQRKRKVADTSIQFWQFASVSLLLMIIVSIVPEMFYPEVIQEKRTLILGAIFIYFYLISIIEAMLLKIMPFLSYTHLQQMCITNFEAMSQLPHMHTLLNKQQGKWLFYFHLFSSFMLAIVFIKPVLYWLFAIAMILEFVWLSFLMLKCVFMYCHSKKQIENFSSMTN